ncbi:hypothetical protein QBC37DRAFT_102572 [Rhypophila decipiens]|uniref:Uncharacterized protein n=1 Tax=Rhypophila decipiens TaxID=261697 RepID=A0AAN6XUY7_9PEZI|nr:hypothetical protein QBC37DRAFT_102572 [Rhypophila decipiens]
MFQPFGPPLVNNTGPSWHPEPTQRGTSNILWTCLITLGLCIWSPLHLNIPAHGRASTQWLNKVPWLVVGIFAPEFVAWAAYTEYREARSLRSVLRKALSETGPPGATPPDPERGLSAPEAESEQRRCPKRKHERTIVHCHFACMGGFCIRDAVDPEIAEFMPPSRPRLVLTKASLLLLAENEPELILDISEADIRDKSKANGLAKALLCFQASWFCVQCIAPMAQGMALTLLELNTFAHAICTVLIYIFWWHKPLDVEEPIAISGPHASAMAGYLLIESKYGSEVKKPNIYPTGEIPDFDSERGPPRGYLTASPRDEWRSAWAEYARHQPDQPSLRDGNFRLYLGEKLHGYCLENSVDYSVLIKTLENVEVPADGEGWRWEQVEVVKSRPVHTTLMPVDENGPNTRPKFFLHVDLEPWQVEALRQASLARQRWGFQPGRFEHERHVELLKTSINNLSAQSDWNESSDMELDGYIGFAMASTYYGLMHALAWNAPFRHDVERLLWRISTIALGAPGPISVLIFVGVYLVPKEKRKLLSRVSNPVPEPCLSGSKITLGLAGVLAGLAYIFARVDLPVQSFISLAHLSPSALIATQWPEYIPHY